jgi:UDP-N-acetylglucosamine--dolichyl-phosphate N-acetylglucosaminephosphotransferase
LAGLVQLDTLVICAIAVLFAFLTTYFLTPRVAKKMLAIGRTGVDIHKNSKPAIPEMCGIAIMVGTTVSVLLITLIVPSRVAEYASFLLASLIAGAVGIADDLKPLSPKLKPALTALAGIPMIILGTYSAHPYLPFIGPLRLTIIYPLLIFFALAVPSNAVNMMDVFNGAMPSTCSVISIATVIFLVLSGRNEEAVLPLALLGSLLAFYIYNRYPARVFAGDAGSLFTGAAIGCIAMLCRVEVATVVAMMPHIMNAFYGLFSVGRLYEHREVKSRPTTLRGDELLEATKSKSAPVTLTRLILAQGPLSEKKIVDAMIALTVFSSTLAIITQLLILW